MAFGLEAQATYAWGIRTDIIFTEFHSPTHPEAADFPPRLQEQSELDVSTMQIENCGASSELEWNPWLKPKALGLLLFRCIGSASGWEHP